jgi:hypothetical protein
LSNTLKLTYVKNYSFLKFTPVLNLKKIKCSIPKDTAFKRFKPAIHSKCKSIPLQALTGPQSSKGLRIPDFKTDTLRWQGCQPHALTAFTPGNIPGTHFC